MKSPAFQVYVNDFLGSAKVGMMNTEEIGAYWLLLFLDWQEHGFVYNEQQLSRWTRLTPARFRKAWVALAPCFEEGEDGRLHSPRLQKEREKQEAWREKSAKGGKKSGEARLKGGSVNGSDLVRTNAQPKTNIPLPLPSPLPVTAKAKTKATEKPSPFPKSACDELYETWTEVRGAIDYGAFRKALAPLFPTAGPRYTQPQLVEAIKAHAEYVDGLAPRQAGFENVHKFAADIQRWVRIGGMPAVDPQTRELTERGRLALA